MRNGGFIGGPPRRYGRDPGIYTLQEAFEAGPPDPHFASVSLLLHCDGPDATTLFPDASNNRLLVTAAGDAQVDTAQSKFGGASALFDGNGDYLSLPTNSLLTFNADFTVELWIRPNTWTASKTVLYGGSNFSIESGGGSDLIVWDGSSRTLGTLPATGSWHHLALTRSGSTLQAWLNGATFGSSWSNSSTTSFTASGGRIGQHGSAGASTSFNGWMDDWRFTKGVARYTGAFTPPARSFPDW